MQVYEVSQVAAYIRQTMEYDEVLGDLWVHGEVSNLSRSPSGHIYFTLKDGRAQLRCALFRSSQRRMGVDAANGISVLAHGRVSFYEAQGACQLYVDALQPEGVGQLYLQFEALRAKLEAEGLFSPERKRPLPRYPRRIGIITSSTGAVIHDFLNVVGRRYPLVEILVAHSSVQGESAPQEIVAALEAINHHHRTCGPLDLVVIARGGGSMEDLAAFNHEGLARAIFASTVPVVSAVGHETDFTIADFVADLRAPTPSAAAELVTPNLLECRMQLAETRRRLLKGIQDTLFATSRALDHARQQLDHQSPAARVTDWRRQVDESIALGHRALAHRLQMSREQVRGSMLRMDTLSPLKTLERGYALCHDRTRNTLVRSHRAVEAGDHLEIRVADGLIHSIAIEQARSHSHPTAELEMTSPVPDAHGGGRV